jgi:hypothetical protein
LEAKMKKKVWDNPDRKVPLGKVEEPPLTEEEETWVEEKSKKYKGNKENKEDK